jgi:hypothetical protein
MAEYTDYVIILKDTKTGVTKYLNKKLIQEHADSLQLKFDNKITESNLEIIGFYRAESYESSE